MRGNESPYCYKLGTGKPLGLGSVKVMVDDVEIRTFNKETLGYNMKSEKEEYRDYYEKDMISYFNLSRERLKMINELTNIKTFSEKEMLRICYPVGYIREKNEKINKCGEGYQWFMTNRGNIGKPVYDQVLKSLNNLPDNENLEVFTGERGALFDNLKIEK